MQARLSKTVSQKSFWLVLPAACFIATGVANAGGATNPGAAAPPPAPGQSAAPGNPGGGDPAAAAASVARSKIAWPCVQKKVAKIDAAAVWDGPPVKDLRGWGSDSKMAALVTQAVSRRTPVEDVQKQIEEWANTVPKEERDEKLTLLFAGILNTANLQRSSVVSGIERYQKRQIKNAEEIERQGAELAKLEDAAPRDLTQPTPELDKAREKYDWFTRVFQERQANIPIACELPVIIEQRVFALSRAIRAQIDS